MHPFLGDGEVLHHPFVDLHPFGFHSQDTGCLPRILVERLEIGSPSVLSPDEDDVGVSLPVPGGHRLYDVLSDMGEVCGPDVEGSVLGEVLSQAAHLSEVLLPECLLLDTGCLSLVSIQAYAKGFLSLASDDQVTEHGVVL
jgi:hypothetical protein